MANGLTPEQEEFLRQQLNIVERFGQSLSFLDEYLHLLLETQNKLLETLGVQGPGSQALASAINNLVAVLGGEPALKNPPKIASSQLLCPVAGIAVQLPGYKIPWDKEFVIKAISANLGTIYVGNTKMEAENVQLGYPLIGGEAVGLKIENSEQLWISATIANEGVHWIVEQE
jgi:hypothetical protein